MDVQRESSEQFGFEANGAPGADLCLRPAPDYKTLGPGYVGSAAGDGERTSVGTYRFSLMLALTVGISLALLLASLGKARAAWSRADRVQPRPIATEALQAENIDQLQPQKQAERLLELAVGDSDAAVDQISSRVGQWRGKLIWDSQMATVTTAALNSSDVRVRQSGVEVELAAYGLSKNTASLEYLLRTAKSRDHAQKIWALWALGLMGNRGVEPNRIQQVLAAHLKDSDADSRRWAVDGLALVGGDSTIPLLLAAMHEDASPQVRQEAACVIAQSGMFTHGQRMSAVPLLLNFADDASLDAQTHGWAFQALADITGEHLPNEAAAWRSWYENRN